MARSGPRRQLRSLRAARLPLVSLLPEVVVSVLEPEVLDPDVPLAPIDELPLEPVDPLADGELEELLLEGLVEGVVDGLVDEPDAPIVLLELLSDDEGLVLLPEAPMLLDDPVLGCCVLLPLAPAPPVLGALALLPAVPLPVVPLLEDDWATA